MSRAQAPPSVLVQRSEVGLEEGADLILALLREVAVSNQEAAVSETLRHQQVLDQGSAGDEVKKIKINYRALRTVSFLQHVYSI